MKAILGCQEYPWSQIYQARGQKLSENLSETFAILARCGVRAWEPSLFASRAEAQQMSALLGEHGLEMPSVYANVRLHEDSWASRVQMTVEAAGWAGEAGARILVVNPEPISWSQPLDKDDAQLEVQAHAMQALGAALREQGQRLAYHIHAPEMRQAAREFHHTMLSTQAEDAGLCLDTHWIYRGAGHSQAALYDIVKLYGSRIVSLHLRQSCRNVWSEVLEDGDIDHAPLARTLEAMSFEGPLIIEQAQEPGTPSTMEPEAALKRSADWARHAFGLAC